ncbi:MAG: hypothetical protein IT285_02180 [Bdellovibrionales bacterium]|nr:hypothetical protein [Bdellovibrionales bacterium]
MGALDARAPRAWGLHPDSEPDYGTLETAIAASLPTQGASVPEPSPKPAPRSLETRSGEIDTQLFSTLLRAQWGRRRTPGGPIIKGGLDESEANFRASAPQRLTVSLKPSANPSTRTGTSPIFRARPEAGE